MSTESERKSGRVVFEDDGRAIWEWQTATGVFERNVSENDLQRLEASNLILQEQLPVDSASATSTDLNTTDGHPLHNHGTEQPRPARFVARAIQVISERARRLRGFLTQASSSASAPPAPRSLIYVLCEEYRRFDLWACYYAFRLDPQARTWDKLRHQRVPWQRDQTVNTLLQRLCSFHDGRTPDAALVGQALTSTSSRRTKSPRRSAH